MTSTMSRPDLHHAAPLQLDFSSTAPRITTGTATPIKQRPREVAPARLPAPYGGPKTCTQCGTTRTPQWREGPCGPKTLCNACGVKLVRKNRGTAEAKRRSADDKAASAAAAAQLFMDRNSPSPEPWSTGGDSGADETPLAVELAAASPCVQSSPRVHEPSPLGPHQVSRRPVRRAAAKAASRTAEYATTGDWPQDEGVVPALGDAQSDASVENSDSAEEVAWAPRPAGDEHATYAADALDLPHSMRQETSAAINLMAMSFKADKARARPSPSPPALSLAVPQTDASVPLQDPQVTPRSASRLKHLRKHAQLSAQEQAIEDFMRYNAPARFSQYEALQSAADASWQAADSAQLSVNAIAKFLAQRQAASMRACDAARTATQLLHTFLGNADADLGVTRSTKRQRL